VLSVASPISQLPPALILLKPQFNKFGAPILHLKPFRQNAHGKELFLGCEVKDAIIFIFSGNSSMVIYTLHAYTQFSTNRGLFFISIYATCKTTV